MLVAAIVMLAPQSSNEVSRSIIPTWLSILVVVAVVAAVLAAGWSPIVTRLVRQYFQRAAARDFHQVAPKFVRELRFAWRHLVVLLRQMLESFSMLFSVVDWFFADVVAGVVGVRIRSAIYRYFSLAAYHAVAVSMAWFAPQPFALVGLVLSFGGIVGVYRRWAWIEDDCQAFLLRPTTGGLDGAGSFRVGFDQDLRDEALTSIAILFVLIPVALRQVQLEFDLFSNASQANFLAWLVFASGELTKAVPFVDWSEVYGVVNGSAITAKSVYGEHVIFALRATFDLLLITALAQGVQVGGRIAKQRELFDRHEVDLVDPFLERELFSQKSASELQSYRFERLLQILASHHEPEMRRVSANILGGIFSDRSSEALIGALQDSDASVRFQAALSLANIGKSGAEGELLQHIRDPNNNVQVAVVRALGRFKNEKVEAALLDLVPELTGRRRDLKWAVIAALGNMGTERSIRALSGIPVVEDDDEEWAGLAHAIGGFKGDVSIEWLTAASRYPWEGVRLEVADSFSRFLPDVRVEAVILNLFSDASRLVRLAASSGINSQSGIGKGKIAKLALSHSSETRAAACRALGLVDSDTTVCETLGRSLSDSDAEVRLQAAVALGRHGGGAQVESLIAALRDSDVQVRASAAKALGASADPRVVLELVACLKDSDRWVRSNAAKGLRNFADARSVKGLLAATKDVDVWVRADAIEALGAVGDRAAIIRGIRMLSDPSEFVRISAANSLAKKGLKRAVQPLIIYLAGADGWEQLYAVRALGAIGEGSGAASCLQILEDIEVDVRVRLEAAYALVLLGDASFISRILAWCSHPDEAVRCAAITMLGELRWNGDELVWTRALNDREASVRDAAGKAKVHRDRMSAD